MLGEWPGNDSTISIHYKVHEATPDLADEPTLRQWLYNRYQEKDELLENFYKEGKFPGDGRPVHFSLARNIMVQVFWWALFYFHVNFWIRPLTGAVFKYAFSFVF